MISLRLFGVKFAPGRTVACKPDLLGIALPAVLLIAWYLVTAVGKVPEYLVPAPVNFGRVVFDFALGNLGMTPYSGTLLDHSLASAVRVAGGFGLAAAAGVPLGYLTGRIAPVKRILDPTIHLSGLYRVSGGFR